MCTATVGYMQQTSNYGLRRKDDKEGCMEFLRITCDEEGYESVTKNQCTYTLIIITLHLNYVFVLIRSLLLMILW